MILQNYLAKFDAKFNGSELSQKTKEDFPATGLPSQEKSRDRVEDIGKKCGKQNMDITPPRTTNTLGKRTFAQLVTTVETAMPQIVAVPLAPKRKLRSLLLSSNIMESIKIFVNTT